MELLSEIHYGPIKTQEGGAARGIRYVGVVLDFEVAFGVGFDWK